MHYTPWISFIIVDARLASSVPVPVAAAAVATVSDAVVQIKAASLGWPTKYKQLALAQTARSIVQKRVRDYWRRRVSSLLQTDCGLRWRLRPEKPVRVAKLSRRRVVGVANTKNPIYYHYHYYSACIYTLRFFVGVCMCVFISYAYENVRTIMLFSVYVCARVYIWCSRRDQMPSRNGTYIYNNI